mmetsp:Transcript_8161/g.8961  ORF Transcript_8161/g.8961 Transcript_8161/m.8961 type:complete len:338 (-) Transcript_8161:2-1015(-)
MCKASGIHGKPLKKPSILARYTCAGISCAIFAAWWKCTFVPESETPSVDAPMHSYHIPLFFTVGYIVSLPILKFLVQKYCSSIDMKELLKDSMLLYNVSQIALNGWMVWRFIDAVVNKGHPFIGDVHTTATGTTYAVWVHYCDKYLEFFDTYFMVLRGRMDQVSFLHVYHHFSIAWGWYIAMTYFSGGDAYFGALLNSFIHVLMYSYYALSLLKISCPWKRYLTQAQLFQFTSVVIYSFASYINVPTEDRTTGVIICYVTQVWEMVSLFALFSFFYMRSYGKKKSKDTYKLDDDQCQLAVKSAVEGAAGVVETAAKDAGKIASTARRTIRYNVGQNK